MLSLSPFKIVIIVVVALVLVGPDKLPGLARQIGGAWKAFRSFSTKIETEVRSNFKCNLAVHVVSFDSQSFLDVWSILWKVHIYNWSDNFYDCSCVHKFMYKYLIIPTWRVPRGHSRFRRLRG